MGIVSLLIFWSMLELGVAMIAICLPTLRPVFRAVSLESMLRSIRSLVSLSGTSKSSRSAQSKQSNESGSDGFVLLDEEGRKIAKTVDTYEFISYKKEANVNPLRPGDF